MDILARLQNVIEVINRILDDRVIDAYALGGATAANIYIPSYNTRDFDFFVHLSRLLCPFLVGRLNES